MACRTGFILAPALITMLAGCVTSEPPPKEAPPSPEKLSLNSLSKSEEDLVFSAIKADHLKNGTEAQFDQLVKKSRMWIQKCSDRYIVYFSPKDYDGLDGGTQETVDRGTLQVYDPFYLPTSCGPYIDYLAARKSG